MELYSLVQTVKEARISLGQEAIQYKSLGRECPVSAIVRDEPGPINELSGQFATRSLA